MRSTSGNLSTYLSSVARVLPGWTAASESNDLNVLQTALREAVDREQYPEAAKLRDQISKLGGGCNQKDWRALGLPEWLADRAERCPPCLPVLYGDVYVNP